MTTHRSIDGVLLRSAAPLPGASQSLTYLQHNQIPFILLTNGGGKHESERVSDVSKSLALATPLTTTNFIQSHTPFADFLRSFPHHPSKQGLPADSTILVAGGQADRCRLVAESYGFENVITPGDIFSAHPEIWPFSNIFDTYYQSFAKPLPRPINPNNPARTATKPSPTTATSRTTSRRSTSATQISSGQPSTTSPASARVDSNTPSKASGAASRTAQSFEVP